MSTTVAQRKAFCAGNQTASWLKIIQVISDVHLRRLHQARTGEIDPLFTYPNTFSRDTRLNVEERWRVMRNKTPWQDSAAVKREL